MVLDYHHYICNNEGEKLTDYIDQIFKTWKNDTPKVHISSPKNKKEYRTHNDYINICDFIKLIQNFRPKSLKINYQKEIGMSIFLTLLLMVLSID